VVVLAGVERRVLARGGLRGVHGDVGPLDERLDVLAVLGEGGQPDRAADLQRGGVDAERLAQPREHALGDRRGVRAGLDAVQHDAELVAAEARDRVAVAQRHAQPRGDLLEEPVALVVAQGVVDLLEVVEVHQHHREAGPVAAGDADGLLDAVAEQDAVRQPGERVVDGLVLLRDRGAPAAVDRVQGQEEEADQREGVVRRQHDDRREPEHQARGGGLGEPVLDEVAPDADALDHRDHGRDDRRVDDEEGERRGEDRRQVIGIEVELARARDLRGEHPEHDAGDGDGDRVLREVERDLARRLVAQQVGDQVGAEQAHERGLRAAGDEQRDGERRRRRRLALGAPAVDLQGYELAQQRAHAEHEQLVMARQPGMPRLEEEDAARRHRPEDDDGGDKAVQVRAHDPLVTTSVRSSGS
jgi:hypothetical protein